MAERIIRLIFTGKNQGAVQSINEVANSLTNVERVSQNASRRISSQGGLLTREWEKFRRTFGYAFSGEATYAIFKTYQNLKDLGTELGRINTMLPDTSRGIQSISDVAFQISTRTGAPLQDVLGSIQNIISSIPGMSEAARQHLIPTMATIEAMGSQITNIDPRSFGSSILALATSFYGRQAVGGPKGPQILQRVASQLIATQQTTPRVSGQELTTLLPKMAGFATAANFTLPQMLALFTTAQRAMGNAATATQYVRQLMIRLGKPTKAEQPYFEQAGLNPQGNMLNMSGMQILNTLIRHGLSLPGGASQQQLQHAINTGDYKQIKVTGQALDFFRQSIGGRMQSEVAMNALVRNLGQITLQEDKLKKSSDLLSQEWNKFASQNKLAMLSNAISNTTLDLMTNLNPAIGTISDGAMKAGDLLQGVAGDTRKWSKGVNDFFAHTFGYSTNNNIVGGITETGLTLGGAALLYKSKGIVGVLRQAMKKIPGLGGRVAEGGSLERGVGGKAFATLMAAQVPEAALNALAGKAQGTPSSPFWVVIHPLSKSTVPGMFGGGGGTGGNAKKAEDELKKVGGYGLAALQIAKRAGGIFGSKAGGVAMLGAAELPALPDAIRMMKGKHPLNQQGPTYQQMIKQGWDPIIARFFTTTSGKGIAGTGFLARKGTPQWAINILKENNKSNGAILDALFGKPGVSRSDLAKGLHSQLNRVAAHHSAQINRITDKSVGAVVTNLPGATGSIDATLFLTPTQELKNLLQPQKVHVKVPTKLWDKSPTPPMDRGKNRTTRNRN